jgi:hypothetical protein
MGIDSARHGASQARRVAIQWLRGETMEGHAVGR